MSGELEKLILDWKEEFKEIAYQMNIKKEDYKLQELTYLNEKINDYWDRKIGGCNKCNGI